MIAVEVKRKDPKYTWEIVGIYRAPNEDILAYLTYAKYDKTKHYRGCFELTPGGLERGCGKSERISGVDKQLSLG
jgi:hypothetical protein